MASITTAQRNRAADAVAVRCNSGVLRAYDGTPPADANAALSGNTLLAEAGFGATAFGAASGGTATANAITQDSSNDATGSPSFVRAFESGGSVVVFQGLAARAWVASTAYVVGDRVANSGNQYRCTVAGTAASSGGPTGTGTGALTLTAISGWPGFDKVLGTSGTRIVDYTVLNADGVPIEVGIGSLALSTMALTRSRVLSTWDGTSYSTADSALSLAAGTKAVICAPTAETEMPPAPFTSTLGDNIGAAPLYVSGNKAVVTLVNQRLDYVPLLWPRTRMVDRASVPEEITMFQARAALLRAGLFDQVDDAVRALGAKSEAWQAWEYANTMKRRGALVAAMAQGLGMSEALLDDLFRLAAPIEA